MRLIGVHLTVCGALAAAATLAMAPQAQAYPQFQLSTGADTCVQCHVSPGGGGLINAYGRDETVGTISEGGNGGFLHGAWTPPEAISLGGDFRSATAIRHKTPASEDGFTETEFLVFPMQAELYLGVQLTDALSVYAAAGLKASARGGEMSVANLFGSREHYVQYRWEDSGHYARAGRFHPIFGVRTQDHTALVRRFQDMYLSEEPYTLAVGRILGRSEWHAQVFAPQPSESLGVAPDAYGAVGYYERRNPASTYAWAAQGKASFYADDRARYTLGTVQKWWLPKSKILFMHEVNIGAERFSAEKQTNGQLATYFSATKMLLPGWMISGVLHGWDPDLRLRANSRAAAEFNVQWLFRSHFELHLLGRAQVEGLATDNPDYLAMMQFHYYL